jgi:hypothetical protein
MAPEVEFDSATGDTEVDDPQGMASNALRMAMAGAGKSFRAKASPHGRLVELVDAKDIMKETDEAMGVDEAQLKSMVEGAFGRLPEKPVAKGGKWSHQDGGSNARMPVKLTAEVTLAACDDESFELDSAGTIEKVETKKTGDADDPMAAALRSMTIVNGKTTGKQKISRKDGFLLEGRNESTWDSEMTAMGRTFPMQVKSSVAVKRTTEAQAMPAKKEAPKKDAPKAEEPKKSEGHE